MSIELNKIPEKENVKGEDNPMKPSEADQMNVHEEEQEMPKEVEEDPDKELKKNLLSFSN